MTDRVVVDAEEGTVSASRKIRKSGNSIVVSFPPQVLEAAGLDIGDHVDLTADMEDQSIDIRKVADDTEE